MKMIRVLLLAVAALVLPVTAASATEDVVIVYDASGSMWGQIDGVNKIVIARDVVSDLIKDWPADTNIGLVAYGHRRAGDCRDIETLIKPGPINRQQFIETIRSLDPKGKTPISASLKQAAKVLSYRDTNATIILISDGMESCHGDPCAVAKALEAKGVDFTAHVVGFDLDEQGNKSLACIADNTGGIFVPAGDAQELAAALQKVQAVVEKKQALPEIKLTAPEQVKAGDSFEVSWSAVASAQDQVMLVPVEAEANTSDNALQVGDNRSGKLTAPAQTGSYQVRYVSAQSGQALARAPVQVIGKTSISAPKQVTAGSIFKVTWTDIINPYDDYTIVAAGAEEGTFGESHRIDDAHEGYLTAPAKPGLYEVRYVLDKGKETLASAPVEIVAAEVGISAPEKVRAGTKFKVTWTNVVNPYDDYTIVPAGAEEGTFGEYHRIDDAHEGWLTAPDKTGFYEVRYVLDKGKVTLASQTIEVVGADAALSSGASLQAPAEAAPGDTITVTWTGGADSEDQRVSLAKADAADFTWIEVHPANADKSLQFTIPDEPGRYEIRYLDISNMKVLGRAIVTVTAPLDPALAAKTQRGVDRPGSDYL